MPHSENKDLATELEIVAGNPTAQELAAVVAVLREATATGAKLSEVEPNWAKGPKMLRETTRAGALEWRSDFKGEI
jgi:hypothetical protein